MRNYTVNMITGNKKVVDYLHLVPVLASLCHWEDREIGLKNEESKVQWQGNFVILKFRMAS